MTSVKTAAAWMALMGFAAAFAPPSAHAQDAIAAEPAPSLPTASASNAAAPDAPAPVATADPAAEAPASGTNGLDQPAAALAEVLEAQPDS